MLFISWERLDEHQGMQLRYSESWVNEQRSEARQDEYYMGCGRIRRNFQFVPQYGESVLNLLDIPPGASVLDLGCGNGVLTRRLADMGYRVIGLDDSSEMLEIAARTYPDLCFMHGDATDFSLPEPVDAVFSNAVFHWLMIRMPCWSALHWHSGPMGSWYASLAAGDVWKVCTPLWRNPLQCADCAIRAPFYFPTIGEYAPRLEAHGLLVTMAALFERPTELKGAHGMEDWIRMFIVRAFEDMREDLKNEIIHEAAERIRETRYREGRWLADYVRIRIKAIKTSGA